MPKLTKEYWKDVSCMVLQDSIKIKRYEINKNHSLYDAIKNAKIIPFDNEIENILSDMISQSTEHERNLRRIVRRIKCKFIEKEQNGTR